jgi:TP901 family phage tail tape measure protein
MSDKLELRVIFAAIDKFVRPVQGITKAAREASKALKENTDQVKQFDRTIAQIDAFKKAEKDAAITANAFKGTRVRIDELNAAITKVGVPTKAMAAELEQLGKKSEALKEKHESLVRTEQQLFAKLKQAGVDTGKLADERMRLGEATARAKNQSQQFSAALEQENQKMKRLRAAQADLEKTKALSGRLAMAGAGVAAGGAAVGLPIAKTGKDFADFETAMLGVARQVDGARDANGRLTASYYEIGKAVKAMSELPALNKTANEIAKIVEAGARMGIQGKENLLIFAQTTAVMASAFDLPVEQIGDDIGKISQLYKVPMKDIKALGDTINWLDDNALAKGGDIIDVMKRIAGTATTVGMNFRDAAALGSTFLSLGANAEVAASASNAMIRELSVATMQTKRFREGAKMLGLDLKALQKSASIDPTGTILRIMEAIKTLPKEKQIEAATRLFGKEFGDDAAKLAQNLDEYRRQLKLVNDEKARGSMQREGDARGDTINARMAAAKNAFTNLSSDLGAFLRPALVEAAEKMLAIVQAVRSWAAEHPKLASSIMTVVKWLSIALGVIGALLIAAGAILAPIGMISFGLTAIGISGATLVGVLTSILGPIAAVTAAFAAGYWVGTQLNEMLDAGISKVLGYQTTFGGAIFDLVELVQTKFGELVGWFQALPTRLTEAGAAMIDGFIAGVNSRFEALKETVVGVATSAVDWVKEKLGIKSPSRVFAEIGQHTMAGMEEGITGNEQGPLDAIAGMAKKLAGIGAGVAIGGAAMAGDLSLDTRAPIASGSAMGASAPMYVTININGAPGQATGDIQAQVELALANARAKQAAQQRSRLRDSE